MQIQRVVHIATATLNSLFGLEEHARRCISGLFGGSLAVYGDDETCCLAVRGSGVFPARLSIEAGGEGDVGALGGHRHVPPGSSYNLDHQVTVCVLPVSRLIAPPGTDFGYRRLRRCCTDARNRDHERLPDIRECQGAMVVDVRRGGGEGLPQLCQ
jgi:hypothetical protein